MFFALGLVFDPRYPEGQPRSCLDVSRAQKLLGFKAETSLQEGLDRTIAWYRAQAGAKAA